MKIRLQDITETPKEVEYEEAASDLDLTVESGIVNDFRCGAPSRVRLLYYRAGLDLFFEGDVEAPIAGKCARCLEEYDFAVSAPIHFLVAPRDAQGGEDEDVNVSTYDGDEVDLTPLVRETVLLNLPTTPLCSEGCRGLCSECGINLNRDECSCTIDDGDPRMAVFRTLRVDRQS